MSISFVIKEKMRESDAIVFVRGISSIVGSCYAFIKADSNGLNKIQNDLKEGGDIKFDQYGEILLRGTGEEPTEQELQYMITEYDFQM